MDQFGSTVEHITNTLPGAMARSAAVVAKQHRLGLGGIDHHRHNHLAVRREFGRRATGHAALRGKGLRNLCTHIKHMHLAAMAAQGARHAAAHGTQADQTDVHFH